jgi:hypothetical protein
MTKGTFDYARSRGNEHKIGQLNPLARYGIAGEVSLKEYPTLSQNISMESNRTLY